MSLWRLEWLRLVRTHRLLVLVGTYLFFGFTGPLTARYLSELLGQLGTEGVKVEFPEPVPADGIAQFVGNASQIGLLVVVLVAASALAFDARREMAVFLRTRVRGVRSIVVPAYVMTAAAAVAGLVAGSVAAWYETTVLLGGLPATATLIGIALGALFLAFAVALTAAVASVMRGVAATAGVSLAGLLGLAILGGLTPVGRWLPTHLAGAMTELVRGTSAADFGPAVLTSLAGTVAALTVAVVLGARREV
jgi:ABC-2 type transport system permease protein